MDREILVWRITGRENTQGWLQDGQGRKGAGREGLTWVPQLEQHSWTCTFLGVGSPARILGILGGLDLIKPQRD